MATLTPPSTVILGLEPRIHAAARVWMLGSSPSMTTERKE
jgi:hypothetical protein